MPWIEFIWDLDGDPRGNVRHIAENGISQDEVAEVLNDPLGRVQSESSGRPIAFGWTSLGRIVAVVYEEVDEDVIYPITAYEIGE